MAPKRERLAPYLVPYARAHGRKARGAHALLWEDRWAQDVRFDAIARLGQLAGRRVLDVGCGRAELLSFLRARGIFPSHYTGIEAQAWLARAARRRRYPRCRIVQADFVKEPATLRIGAEVMVFSGSLNFLSSRQFYRTLELAWAAARRRVVFNFLCSPDLAGAPALRWHRREVVAAFARSRGAAIRIDEGYEAGDCTVAMTKRIPDDRLTSSAGPTRCDSAGSGARRPRGRP
jgi:hypothetical protein